MLTPHIQSITVLDANGIEHVYCVGKLYTIMLSPFHQWPLYPEPVCLKPQENGTVIPMHAYVRWPSGGGCLQDVFLDVNYASPAPLIGISISLLSNVGGCDVRYYDLHFLGPEKPFRVVISDDLIGGVYPIDFETLSIRQL